MDTSTPIAKVLLKYLSYLTFTALFACGSLLSPSTNDEADAFQAELFGKKQIEPATVVAKIESLAYDEVLEELSGFRAVSYYCGDGSREFKVYHNRQGALAYIGYSVEGTEMNSAEYFANGIAACIHPRDSIGRFHGRYVCYHDDGSVRQTGEYNHGKDLKTTVNFEPGVLWEDGLGTDGSARD